ncbi:MAG TPA: alpha-ribazole phosphatase CobZ [Elusimicrobia bacterium]|nr:MAG: hypothetical protein A2278_07395 [Elusimicrobia bacterium RIFOXYA12_FULL_49_49]OGS10154.1 MAG: hypothetical protein A2204_03850 [Elusimicrobia bacterium RIFOXYA1_FULL_47_7]OGS16109.1 MAG: hypothetical protein A2251_02870 [Elusimicrobia bacterium RIFOXYA2_FULL_47_53]OGS26735.1 MAG: hypothetical protein A2339_03920 [Elusimicrobia bacterium RIFOXYB12_FULL_50_12]OGS30139.1 MAG: hypothetical protein A2323_01665 [Elusimicrobia bacterium RIFOXYB2_FULL_46_23]HBU69247.1 alpha-ribazole phosphata
MKKKLKAPTVQKALADMKISSEDIARTALSTYIYDPGIGSAAKVSALFKKELAAAFRDINISSLVMSAVYLERAGSIGLIPGISAKYYSSDPVSLIADELIGQSIAVYIGGSRAIFEFSRLDRLKPGIISRLPPFMDDCVAGLISGIMVKICSK